MFQIESIPEISEWLVAYLGIPTFGLWNFIAAALPAIISAGAALFGAKKSSDAQRKAIESASGISSADQNRLIDLQEMLLAEDEPVRAAKRSAALKSLGLLESDISREPGTGAVFTTGLKRGLTSLSSQLAPFGSTLNTSPAFVRELTEGLLSKDIESIRGSRFKLAGFAPELTTAALGLNAPISSRATDLANLQLGQGLVQAGLYQNYGDIASSLARQIPGSFNRGSSTGSSGNFIGNYDPSRFNL